MSFAQIFIYECAGNLLSFVCFNCGFLITFTGNLDFMYYNCISLSKPTIVLPFAVLSRIFFLFSLYTSCLYTATIYPRISEQRKFYIYEGFSEIT